ncbi:Transposase DDE domain-containing protein [Nitrosomonas eutropha]|uniref:DDE family transposase n=1 Tax=Nitrosomonas eutropha TaxID=916 RepID=A0ABX5M8R9_9PROT|nr:DDE family transposase [Nitrosomonas eutropha]SCX00427.1 Transposase DDE domain-containing protein [Nitrosomonas eutropha]SEI84494.1 Transposase DDE domain-containing protein [Nitrosomonas eutropha]
MASMGCALKNQISEARIQAGCKRIPKRVIVDAQSVKNVKNTDTAEEKGYDADKKMSEIKRHIVVDTLGLPHAIAATTAEVTGCKGTIAALTPSIPTVLRIEHAYGFWLHSSIIYRSSQVMFG